MGTVIVQMKIMPSSPEADLEAIKKAAEEKINEKREESEKNEIRFEEKPIAFGLKSILATFTWPEEKELEDLQEELKKIENTNSVEVEDMRRSL